MSEAPASPYRIVYPPELPVSQAHDELARAIRDHQVVVVAGATGSGKTTQLPKICLELGRTRIGHTQPRRIAARSVAERIASELGVELGGVVGYQVRFDDRTKSETAIKLMTDGVLLAELSRDRDLRAYDTIIIDEAHERSLTIDFLLGYLKQLLPRRPDLKVIVTSATIDPESFARHFADAAGEPAPVVEVSGRTYPVELRYRPLVAEALTPDDDFVREDDTPHPPASGRARGVSSSRTETAEADGGDVQQGIVDALVELGREEPGDVLVFLSGESEIRDAADVVAGRFGADTEVVPLYGRLSAADQHRVFDTKRRPGIRRRVVLATNVAETSLTVPGIRYVVDAGTARISRYSPRAKVQRLPIEAISQASANQRSGRAGRTSPGIAIRLYSEEDFARRPEFTDPEVLRTGLAAVILQMLELRLGDIRAFPFLTPPDARGIADGLDLLAELGAVDAAQRITRVGRDLARLPVDPRFARMLVEAKTHGVVREVAAIVAGLSIQDPRERPLEKRPQADAAHARFRDPGSDFVSLLNLWNHLEEKQQELSGNAFRRMCKAEYLNYLRVREWQDLYRQVTRAGKSVGLTVGAASTDADAIHRSVLAGLLSRLGLRDAEKKDYLGSRGQRFVIFPGSGLAKKQPNAVMAAELVETSRLFARTVAAIDPAWAEPIAGELAKRSHSEPHWSSKQGAALVWEKVTLYGVPIVPRRRAQLARIDAPLARELFIRHALVEGDWPHELQRSALLDFDRANEKLRRELAEVEERTRRRDILTGDEAVYEFYERRIPDEVTDSRRFASWWKRTKAEQPELLTMSRAELLEDDDAGDAAGFPDEWVQGDARFRIRYRFEPGADDDGVTVVIPLAVLPRVAERGFDWLVPGLREDLVTALIKALPKQLRRHVVPAGDWARRLVGELPVLSDVPVGEAVAEVIRAAVHIPITASDIEWERVPAHLRMRFEVVDQRGKTLAAGRDLPALQARLAERARTDVAVKVAAVTPGRELERTGITSWDLGTIPEQVTATQGGSTIVGYPALVDAGAGVELKVFATRAEAHAAHPRGVRRLVALTLPSPLGYVQEQLTGPEKLVLATAPYPNTKALLDDVLLAVVDELAGDAAPRDEAGFAALRERVSGGLMDALFRAAGLTARVLTGAKEADKAISRASSLAFMGPLADARGQLEALVHPGFVRITGLAQLARVPVYLAGIRHRAEKLADNPGRDRAWQTQVEEAVALYRAAGGTLPLAPTTPAHLVPVRWMLEELRLSLFAQHLGAAGPISVQRIRKALTPG
ncbi:ATP-dependent RNA helicase HrpA [Protaetiibacter intestinalis]|uniref:ATP-dependent RNA helicase HrpA n=1 Tax=Protaetiibacter intestinalis TaxID=2419774 RepID=A0A387B192_9MICO|nr:ATP-dependent RNA helicase HrpA [Protaetiibacter intestinalis]AYF97284.1 ATP-dependent RNA helicase HrpA [Protaetiibacter intestinalis]